MFQLLGECLDNCATEQIHVIKVCMSNVDAVLRVKLVFPNIFSANRSKSVPLLQFFFLWILVNANVLVCFFHYALYILLSLFREGCTSGLYPFLGKCI